MGAGVTGVGVGAGVGVGVGAGVGAGGTGTGTGVTNGTAGGTPMETRLPQSNMA